MSGGGSGGFLLESGFLCVLAAQSPSWKMFIGSSWPVKGEEHDTSNDREHQRALDPSHLLSVRVLWLDMLL